MILRGVIVKHPQPRVGFIRSLSTNFLDTTNHPLYQVIIYKGKVNSTALEKTNDDLLY
ncbi:hypothetical protein NBG4_250012 [Candidatus Sulfobium mesophilum]|uniref:Uncharacterized protein n=1 Tax=Candidatus Sulfobium mesophilum TaxID=2016548 RepID=A0A2U3QGL3_9BACT|nr:hypothetical protein NBG4_250012 [Candidatus Sulfobium mesophilum]